MPKASAPSASLAVTFPNQRGQRLAGRIDRPRHATPRAYAVIAHCFTCGKDLKGIYHLAKVLAAAGIGCLRFDFTGLGDSEGDFATTHLATNIEDLRAAVDFLARHYTPPQLLIGHSLGGAAALLAAPHLAPVRALALIGTPSDLDHLEQRLPAARTAARSGAPAPVLLAGHKVAIGPHFLAVLQQFNLARAVRELHRPLLILHAPRDEVVGVEHAENLFRWAHHPKSMVALADADHILSAPQQARHAGRLIATWGDPFLAAPRGEATPRVATAPGDPTPA